MFGIGMPELLVILALALILIGPKKLPDLAKSLGRALGEFKRATSDLKQTLEIEHEISEVKKTFGDVKGEIQEGIDASMRPADESARGGDNMDKLKSAFDDLNESGDENDTDDPASGGPHDIVRTDPEAPKTDEADPLKPAAPKPRNSEHNQGDQ